MARSKVQGLISLQFLLGLIAIQMLLLASLPGFKSMLESTQAKFDLNQLEFQINYLRWLAIVRHQVLYLRPLSLEGDWHHGWTVSDKHHVLWQKKPYQFIKVRVKWYGFEQNPPLVFYPDLFKNHLNGYFDVQGYRLWINRLGHTRLAYEL